MTYVPWMASVSEDLQFFEYQLRKSAFTLVLHSFLPFGKKRNTRDTRAVIGHVKPIGYFLGLISTKILSNPRGPTLYEFLLDRDERWMLLCMTSASCLGTITMYFASGWSLDNWAGHPYVKKLMPYAQNGLW